MLPLLNSLDVRVEHFTKKHTIIPEGAPAKYIGIVFQEPLKAYVPIITETEEQLMTYSLQRYSARHLLVPR